MPDVTLSKSWTVEELDALPADGVDRWLVRGELREAQPRFRTRFQGAALVRLGVALSRWERDRREPRGQALRGDAGFILSRTPDTLVGIDIADVGPEVLAATPPTAPYFEGPPVLAVEILSPWDTQGEVDETIELDLATGVKVIWTVNLSRETILVTRRGARDRSFTAGQTLDDEPELAGLRVEVNRVFFS